LIRPPDARELENLREIERAAGALFAEIGMTEVAEDEPSSIDELTEYLHDGRVWVVLEEEAPVGYALVDIVDGNAHLEQLSVDPEHSRRGHGAALLAQVSQWAFDNGYASITLSTFEHVEWNAPYYSRHGFEIVAEDQVGPELRALRDEETRHGLDPNLRVVMRRDVAHGQNAP
jgi:GNAT superfamily N-acetyltransferase